MNMQPNTQYEDYLRKEKIKHLILPPKAKVLDVGGGDGSVWRGTDLIKDDDLDIEFHNVDIDEDLMHAAWDVYDVQFTPEEFENDHFYSLDSYDVVTMLGLLEHVDDPVELLASYLGPKHIYITVPNANSYHRAVGVNLGILKDEYELGPQDLAIGHQRVFDSFTLRKVAQQACANAGIPLEFYTEYRGQSRYKFTQFTIAFKMFDGVTMMQFSDKFDALNSAAEQMGLIGEIYSDGYHVDGDNGAEIVMRLERFDS